MKYFFLPCTFLFCQAVLADTTAVTNAISSITGSMSLSVSTFLSAVLVAVQNFGGLSWALKIAVVVSGLVGLLKITSLSTYWKSLGNFQSWLAPILGLILGALMLATTGTITVSGIFAYMGAGSGAVLLHELLDGIKAIPGLGSVYVGVINFIESVIPTPLSRKKP